MLRTVGDAIGVTHKLFKDINCQFETVGSAAMSIFYIFTLLGLIDSSNKDHRIISVKTSSYVST